MISGYEDIISLLAAAGLGAIIGLERELNAKPAGLRTNILICVGATTFTILSVYIAGEDAGGQQGRLAAQIVSGVGFLGAGAIIQDRGGIQGLTTAASIWLVASVGVACGLKAYGLAVTTTALAITALLIFQPVTRYLHKKGLKIHEHYHQKEEENKE